jgi:hypothetical protein
LRSACLAALLLAACAHAPPGPDGLRSERVEVDGASVVVRHPESDADAAGQVARVLPAAVRAAARWGPLPADTVVTIQPGPQGLAAVAGARASPWMRAWARRGAVDLQAPRTWSRGAASDEALRQILAHELTHCVLFERAGPRWQERRVPHWFLEGMASVAAGERHRGARAEGLGSPGDLLATDPRAAYATADRAFRDLLLQHGEARVAGILDGLAAGLPFPDSFREATGTSVSDFEAGVAARLQAVAARETPPPDARGTTSQPR